MCCTVCGHDWCWTCGYPRRHWFHRIQGEQVETGFFCEFVNSFLYQYYRAKHPCCILPVRVISIVLLSILGPVFGFLFALVVAPVFLTGTLFINARMPVAAKIALACPCAPIVYAIILTIIVILGTIMFALLPFIYVWLIIRIIYM